MWEELYEKYYPELLKYAASTGQSQAEAEDLAQEVFLRALQSGALFEELGPCQRRAWLYRTLKNALCDRYRRRKQEKNYLEAMEPEGAFLELLQCLSGEDRALFHLRYEEGYNASELSRMLGIPAGTIRARLSRMRTLLKTILE